MDNWITLISFGFPEDARLVQSRLEAEGIKTIIKDEFTSQVLNVYSNIIGGTKIEIREQDLEFATRILIDLGYISVEKPQSNRFLNWLDAFTSKIPIVGKTILEFRLVIFILLSLAFIFILVLVTIKLASMPSKKERIISKTWSVDKMYLNGKQLHPKSTNTDFFNDSALIVFHKFGVELPGLNSRSISAKWTFEYGKLNINRVDSLKNIYEGEYWVEVSDSTLEIESDNLRVICHSLY